MCRFALYLGDTITVSSLVTEPVHSIIRQSFQSKEQERPLNGDGFGIAWYIPEISDSPAVFKDITPAWNDMNLLNLARVTRSPCILAHVRAATQGFPVVQLNCHPFVCGPYAFMHNGRVEGFQQFRRKLLDGLSERAFQLISGSTDSEHAFALFMDHIWEHENVEMEPVQRMTLALDFTIRKLEDFRLKAGEEKSSFLNLAVTDGQSAVVSRFVSPGVQLPNSLYYSAGSHFHCRDGQCYMDLSRPTRAVIIASEPLSEENCWISIHPNHLITVDPQLKTEISQIETKDSDSKSRRSG